MQPCWKFACHMMSCALTQDMQAASLIHEVVCSFGYMEVSQNQGYLFGNPHNKDYSILGSILASLYFGILPYVDILKVEQHKLKSQSVHIRDP